MTDKKKKNLGDLEIELGDKFRKKWKEMDKKINKDFAQLVLR